MIERPPPIPEIPAMSGQTGNRVLMGASAGASLIGILALLGEWLVGRGLSEAVGFGGFMSAPLGVCGLLLGLRVFWTVGRRSGGLLLGLSGIYWGLFVVGVF